MSRGQVWLGGRDVGEAAGDASEGASPKPLPRYLSQSCVQMNMWKNHSTGDASVLDGRAPEGWTRVGPGQGGGGLWNYTHPPQAKNPKASRELEEPGKTLLEIQPCPLYWRSPLMCGRTDSILSPFYWLRGLSFPVSCHFMWR